VTTLATAVLSSLIQCGKSATEFATAEIAIRVPWSSPSALVQGMLRRSILTDALSKSANAHLSAENTGMYIAFQVENGVRQVLVGSAAVSGPKPTLRRPLRYFGCCVVWSIRFAFPGRALRQSLYNPILRSEAAQCQHSCDLSTNCDYRSAVSAMNLSSLKPGRRMRMGKRFTKTAMF
jgi:hypothetical protein